MKQIRDERERKGRKNIISFDVYSDLKTSPEIADCEFARFFFIVLRAASNRGLKIAENRSVRVAGMSLVATFARIFTEKSSTLKVSLEKGMREDDW